MNFKERKGILRGEEFRNVELNQSKYIRAYFQLKKDSEKKRSTGKYKNRLKRLKKHINAKKFNQQR